MARARFLLHGFQGHVYTRKQHQSNQGGLRERIGDTHAIPLATMRTSCNGLLDTPFSDDDANFLYFHAHYWSHDSRRLRRWEEAFAEAESDSLLNRHDAIGLRRSADAMAGIGPGGPEIALQITGSSHRRGKTTLSGFDYRKSAPPRENGTIWLQFAGSGGNGCRSYCDQELWAGGIGDFATAIG